jgi:CheY-like chemotaxis protein
MFVLGEYLAGLGYRVLKAIDGEQAFEILATKPHLDLMVTDYRLPGGISGVQIAEPALLLRPELKVIFISGYPQEILDCNSPITRNAPILAKPFDLDTLQEHIQRLLA